MARSASPEIRGSLTTALIMLILMVIVATLTGLNTDLHEDYLHAALGFSAAAGMFSILMIAFAMRRAKEGV